MKKVFIKSISILFVFIFLFSFAPMVKAESAEEIAYGIINWKKSDNGADSDEFLINDNFLTFAGTTAGDWFPIGLGRLGIKDDYDGYLSVIKEYVKQKYSENGKLSRFKATEWHRISLAILAMGGDPTNVGLDNNGNVINLIADGTYDRGKTISLGRQGINGWIWGLIALDSMRYEIPEGAYYSRDDIIIEILCRQLDDGGFALSVTKADPDITAMAIQSLAPYYNDEKKYEYMQICTHDKIVSNVRQAVDKALDCLSELQLDTGDFYSWGTNNVESTDQVLIALCSLGIDALNDERFIKNGNTLLDGIMRYQMKDKGFVHSYTYDANNPSSKPDKSNSMASEQTLYTMASLWRYHNNMRSLYDFRDEMSAELKSRVSNLINDISNINEKTDKNILKKLLSDFYSIPENERSYVSNYWTLSDMAKRAGINVLAIADNTEIIGDDKNHNTTDVILYFSESDKALVNSLPDDITTEYYVTVVKLLDKINISEDFDEKEYYLEKLTLSKEKISAIQKEIDSINKDIKEKLYPFEKMSLADKKTVDKIVERYEKLSDYDKQFIGHYEDVEKTLTKINNILRAIIIACVFVVIASALTIIVIVRINKRKNKKKREMEELAKIYEEEE